MLTGVINIHNVRYCGKDDAITQVKHGTVAKAAVKWGQSPQKVRNNHVRWIGKARYDNRPPKCREMSPRVVTRGMG